MSFSGSTAVLFSRPLDKPLGIRLLTKIQCDYHRCISQANLYKLSVLVVTFIAYANYHCSRRPSTIVRSVLHRNCSELGPTVPANESWCNWAPFDGPNYQGIFGTLDYAYLFSYAVGMFVSGHIAERMNLRTFLSGGMILCGLTTCAFGGGYFWEIHSLSYYVMVQVAAGLVQSTGWPAVCAAVGNWIGKGKRGFVTGVWNSHTFIGNIIGSLVASAFLDYWGWSFIVPGLMIVAAGVIVALFLVPHPADIGLPPPLPARNDRSEEAQVLERHGSVRARETESAPNDSNSVVVGIHQDSMSTVVERSRDMSFASTSETTSERHVLAPISLSAALCIPGVAEYSVCLFFVKLVSYTFLFWLPNYISSTSSYNAAESAWLSTLNDVGGIVGGMLIGIAADRSGRPGLCSFVVLLVACPVMWLYYAFGNSSLAVSILLLFILGIFINGPYTLITTAVSQDLGEHRILRGNTNAIATVTAIIDGTGSIGAAVGPLLTGWIAATGWQNVFYMLIAADIIAALVSYYIVVKHERERSRAEVEKEQDRASRRPSESSRDEANPCTTQGLRLAVLRNRVILLCAAVVVILLVCYALRSDSAMQPSA